ncbi:hypothetical protein AU509_12345 [Lonsdalea britannica]|uniref:Antibiotic biosynthesis monooxygenase n=1 Tax=Lonsdalea britannica TaxID=1082704 RepID=A0AAD0WLH4_9GAMM|nr:hypothetical protein [Lonsdalea britannica]AXW87859.1 hypothetical protein CKQ53_13365 [Lonsdalea britannica]OSM95981.1 hypothetical protein AU509_12345 [Lonsdalea britannica]OSN06898.1 hypothetical protein AU510_06725 [Lonsdalea britannica]
MIVRTWHGCVPIEHAEGFARHLQRTGVDHARSVRGNCGAEVQQRSQGAYEHFFLATYWNDLSAIKMFAGEDYPEAVTYPDDEQFGLISDPLVLHHEVVAIQPLLPSI